MVPLALVSVALLYSLSQDDWNEVQHEFLVMWYHWCWHHMELMVLSMAPLHTLVEDGQNEVQQDFLVNQHHWK